MITWAYPESLMEHSPSRLAKLDPADKLHKVDWLAVAATDGYQIISACEADPNFLRDHNVDPHNPTAYEVLNVDLIQANVGQSMPKLSWWSVSMACG